MSDFSIPLSESENVGGIFRARNLEGEDFRDVLTNFGSHGPSFVARAEILAVCSGKLNDGGNGTLIIFRFTFIPLKDSRSQRFISAKITVEFGDLQSRMVNDPEVVTVLPQGQQELDILTLPSDHERELNATAGVNPGIVNFELGGRWKVSQSKDEEHSARLAGVKFNNRDSFTGSDNAAIWKLDEHTSKKKGVPNFLQTAVIVRRKCDDKFQMKIRIDTKVDQWTAAKESIKKLIGKAQPEPVDPVNIGPKLFRLKEVDIPELVGEGSNGEVKLEALDLAKCVGTG